MAASGRGRRDVDVEARESMGLCVGMHVGAWARVLLLSVGADGEHEILKMNGIAMFTCCNCVVTKRVSVCLQ